MRTTGTGLTINLKITKALGIDVPPTIVSSFLALTLWCGGTASSHAAGGSMDSAYTEYDIDRCPHRAGRDVEDYGEWRCKGLDGITVLVNASDQRMTMSFGSRAESEPAAAQTLRGFNDIDRGRIEWRVTRKTGRRSHPFAAIVRWSTSVVDERGSAGKTIKGKVLVVTRLGPGGVCHIGYVDALANANASELARKIADERAASFRCDTDKPVIVGETGPGFSSSGGAIRGDGARTSTLVCATNHGWQEDKPWSGRCSDRAGP